MQKDKIDFTPGPWTWSHAPMADYNFYVWDTKKQAICFWYGEGVSVEENRANARLIACAPELFDLVQLVAELNDCDLIPYNDSPECGNDESLSDRASALLKKIEGGGG